MHEGPLTGFPKTQIAGPHHRASDSGRGPDSDSGTAPGIHSSKKVLGDAGLAHPGTTMWAALVKNIMV